MHPELIQEIQHQKDELVKMIACTPVTSRTLKIIDGTGGNVSIADLIAYQIGWGKCLISWYESGIKGETPQMPGEGFSSWDYVAIARHFYQKYHYDASNQQMQVFDNVTSQIIEIVKTEHQTNQLDQLGVWPWCTLSSGKQWPLSKWIRINTSSPFKRAALLIRKANGYRTNSNYKSHVNWSSC